MSAADGPFDTEAQARAVTAAVYAAFDADRGTGKMAPHNYQMLSAAIGAAGIEMGAYDRKIVAWLAGWEPQVCAVIAGLITRASQAGQR